MARQKQFDRDDVLERAMRLFWARGYAATSIQDLVEATGVNRASLYATFGDKERLFLAAIDHYVARVSAERLAVLEGPGSPRTAIARYFDRLVVFALGEGRGLGCLLTNSTVELAPHDPEAAASLCASLARVEDALCEAVRRGQTAGEMRTDRDPRALARFLLCTVQGLRVLMRAQADEATLRDVVNVTLSTLERPALRSGTSVPDKGWCDLEGGPPMSTINPLFPRQPVPELEVETVDGGTWRLAEQKPENFTLVVFYRGLHCPICSTYLGDLARRLDEFGQRGTEVIAISSDDAERARTAKEKWGLERLAVGYGLDLDKAREWGLYISSSRGRTSGGVEEPALFSEPGLFLVRPDGTLYFASVQTMPFARPQFGEILKALDFVLAKDYPPRGEVIDPEKAKAA